jgi:hypothetical protein
MESNVKLTAPFLILNETFMIKVNIHNQPDDETCGPTSLHAIYKYYGLEISLDEIINGVERSLSGGTLASTLGKHALNQGFKTTMYVNNLNFYDPSWFVDGKALPGILKDKLKAQIKFKKSKAFIHASNAYLNFIEAGGEIRFSTLSIALLKKYFDRKIPILTGLSATYLYQSARERFTTEGQAYYDDVRGLPCGHFVVLCGFDETKKAVVVADPHRANPIAQENYYKIDSQRLINAILLGVLTFDANLLILQPRTRNGNHNSNR